MKNRSLATRNLNKKPKLALYYSISYWTHNRRMLRKRHGRGRPFGVMWHRLLTELSFSLRTLKNQVHSSDKIDIIIFYDDDELKDYIMQEDYMSDWSRIIWKKFDNYTEHTCDHKWTNIDALWDDYDAIWFCDVDTRWFNKPVGYMHKFLKSNVAMKTGPSHGFKYHEVSDYKTENEWMAKEFIMGVLKEDLSLDVEHYKKWMSEGRGNAGTVIVRPSLWKKRLTDEYVRLKPIYNDWCKSKYGTMNENPYFWKQESFLFAGTVDGEYNAEERVLSAVMAMNCERYLNFDWMMLKNQVWNWLGKPEVRPPEWEEYHKNNKCLAYEQYAKFTVHHYFGCQWYTYIPTVYWHPLLKEAVTPIGIPDDDGWCSCCGEVISKKCLRRASTYKDGHTALGIEGALRSKL